MNQTEYKSEIQKLKQQFKAVRNQIDFLHERLIKLEGTTVYEDVKPKGESYMYWPGEEKEKEKSEDVKPKSDSYKFYEIVDELAGIEIQESPDPADRYSK